MLGEPVRRLGEDSAPCRRATLEGMLVHVVADYGEADLALAEVAQRLATRLPGAALVYTSVPPFATLAAGFATAQLALNEGPPGMAVFQNVAPRQDDPGVRRDNDGERLVYARLPGGAQVVGPNSGYAFSFLRPLAKELRFAAVSSGGSQFRSRDSFAAAFASLVQGDRSILADEVPEDAIPAAPASAIAYVDGYGNMKTTLTSCQAEPGTKIMVRVGDVEREAVVAGGAFSVPSGKLAFSPGSSGWLGPDGQRLRFRELFLRGGNAWAQFGRPPVGSEIRLRVKAR